MADFKTLNGYNVKDEQSRNDIQTINTELESINSDIEIIEGDISSLGSSVETVQGNLQTLSNDIEDIESDLSSSIKTIFLDRGNNGGDCTLIQTKNKNILVDLGAKTSLYLVNKLQSLGVSKIDAIIISHFHGDHVMGNTSTEFENFLHSAIDFTNCVFYMPTTPDYTQFLYGDDEEDLQRSEDGAYYIPSLESSIKGIITNAGYTIVNPSDLAEYVIDEDVRVRFLNADTQNYTTYYDQVFYHSNLGKYVTIYNNFSLVAEFTHKNHVFLFTGDIEQKAQELIVDDLKTVDVLKVEHHGVNRKTNRSYLYKVRPQIAVAMNTTDLESRFETPSFLKLIGSRLYATNESGDVIVTSNDKEILVQSENGESQFIAEPQTAMNLLNINGVRSLKQATSNYLIKSGEDLNDYLSGGTYYFDSLNNSNISNAPFDSGSFKLIVEEIVNDARFVQIAIRNKTVDIYVRYLNKDNNVVTSGEWEKIETSGNIGSAIARESDLNDFTKAGKYYSAQGTITTTLSNVPTGVAGAFSLKVEYTFSNQRPRQTIITATTTNDTYVRQYTSTGWSNWQKVTMTDLT